MSPVVLPFRRKTRRQGFTLIELLIAIVIIAVLIALIAPAVFNAMESAKIARVRTEISNLEAAIVSFKASYGGHEPPSRITLHHNQAGWDGDLASKSLIRNYWPEYDFSLNDLNLAGPVTLTAQECLVFFLGGRPVSGSPTGFSKDVKRPFQGGTGGREGPFFEFDKSRLVAGTNTGFLVYVDQLSGTSGTARPYLYFSSYEGEGYRAADLTGSGIANIYLTAAGGPPWKAQSFQIISAGRDGDFGSGGRYDTTQPNNALSSTADHDNITNIAPGRLN